MRNQRHLRRGVLRAHPWPLDLNAPAGERDLPVVAAVPVGDPVGVVAAPRAAHLLGLLGHQLAQHAEAKPTLSAGNPSLAAPTSSPSALAPTRAAPRCPPAWRRPTQPIRSA